MSEPPLFALSAAVFARRDGKILLLKRAMGEAPGAWYLPGGAVDAGETVEEAAVRELMEEAGIAPTGPLRCVGVTHMFVYGREALQVAYAVDCNEGDVRISDEHSGARWGDAREYRDRYFNDDVIAGVETQNAVWARTLRNICHTLDAYLEWCELTHDGAAARRA